MLPLSPYAISPLASMTIAASMMPIDGIFKMAALPLNSGFSSSFQLSIGRLIKSGRMPSVSALYTVGIRVIHCVGSLANVLSNSLGR